MTTSLPAMSGMIGVLVADSNRMQAQLLSSALRRRPGFRISICLMEHAAILQALTSTSAEVAVISLSAFGNIAESLAALRSFHLSHPEIAKVVLMESYDRELVVGAFRSGARGVFCIGESQIRELFKCIQRVADGQIWANTRQMNDLLSSISDVPSMRVCNSRGDALLTPRQEQVVALVSEGLSNRQIARELTLSEHTVKKYLFHIFDKLGISTRVELALYAANHGDSRHAPWLISTRPTVPTA